MHIQDMQEINKIGIPHFPVVPKPITVVFSKVKFFSLTHLRSAFFGVVICLVAYIICLGKSMSHLDSYFLEIYSSFIVIGRILK